jgi:hypothetical protein
MCLCHLPERFTPGRGSSGDACPNGARELRLQTTLANFARKLRPQISLAFQSIGWNKVLLPESFTQTCLKMVCPFGALHDKVSSSFRL